MSAKEIIAELRRVLNERDEAREQLDLTKRELGRWVDRETKAVRERDEARAEVERLNEFYQPKDDSLRERIHAAMDRAKERHAREQADHAQAMKDAYRRGAEAMRETCADMVRSEMTTGLLTPANVAQVVRMLAALPIPEEP